MTDERLDAIYYYSTAASFVIGDRTIEALVHAERSGGSIMEKMIAFMTKVLG